MEKLLSLRAERQRREARRETFTTPELVNTPRSIVMIMMMLCRGDLKLLSPIFWTLIMMVMRILIVVMMLIHMDA